MYWTLGANATAYTSLTVNGVPQFQSANAAAGIPQGTAFTPAFFNDLQGENINIVLSAEMAPAQNTPTQVLQGLKRIFGGNFTVVEASASLTLDQLGFIEIAGFAEIVVGFPAPGALTPLCLVYNSTGSPQTLYANGGVFIGPGGNNTNTMTMAAGDVLLLRSDTQHYVVTGFGVPLSQIAADFAALNGSAAEMFNVAPPESQNNAVPWESAFAGYDATNANLAADRAFSVTYTNNYGRPFLLAVNGTASGVCSLGININGASVFEGTASTAGQQVAVCGIVLPGQEYEVFYSNSSASLNKWTET